MSLLLKYKDYRASIEYIEEDKMYVGKVLSIADSLNFHGDSVDEVKVMFEQCIDNYLELCKKISKNPNKGWNKG